MKKAGFLFLLLMFHTGILFSQEMRLVEGTMKDATGEPLPGVSIVIKGTTTGTVTNMEGYYRIKAPLGSVLIFSYIGFTTREITVSLRNSVPVNDRGNENTTTFRSSYTPLQLKENSTPQEEVTDEGVAVFTLSTPSYLVENNRYFYWNSPHDTRKIKRIDFDKDIARIDLVNTEYYKIPHISFVSSATIEKHSRMPRFQSTFVQGRPVNGVFQWQGPETGEIFSWGPSIHYLEYDGIPYAFHAQGKLVPKGTGNGENAKSFDRSRLFTTGGSLSNSLKIFLTTDRIEYSLICNNKINWGILPGTGINGNNAEYRWKYRNRSIKAGLNAGFDQVKSNFPEGSPANNLVIASIFTNPVSFDPTGGKKASKAYATPGTYQFADDSQRSFAPGKANHPYWLLRNISDKETNRLYTAQTNLEVSVFDNFNAFSNVQVQKQENSLTTGYRNQPSGTENPGSAVRDVSLTTASVSSGLKGSIYLGDGTLHTMFRHDYSINSSHLKRTDQWLLNDSRLNSQYSLSRHEHNLNLNAEYSDDQWVVKMNHNLSGDNHYKSYRMMYAPAFAFAVNLHNIVYIRWVNQLKMKANWGYSYLASPVYYPYGKYNFQNFESENFHNTTFDQEIIPDLSLRPEKIMKKNAGIEMALIRNRLNINFDIYENKTSGAIFPVSTNAGPVPQNLAGITIRGIDAGVNIFTKPSNQWSIRFDLGFDRYRSEVTQINNGADVVQLGGFTDVHTALVKGRPAGVIIGTMWERDPGGNIIIGSDGYPLPASTTGIIANPEPDFNLSFETTISYRNLSAGILLEYRKGGEVWNGTANVLSYYGLAEKTAGERSITGYVFKGVHRDGTVNTIPVDFANPAKAMDQNRWYRYGPTGVAEDAVEDASWFRIREISLNYKIQQTKFNPEVSVFVRNPLLITRYQGVDPASTLWEKTNTAGMDLFNMPGVSSMGISLKITL